MSAAAFLLQFVFALLGFFLSLKGLFAFLIGMLVFMGMPVVPRLTNELHSFARFHLFFATSMLKRAAVVVSEHGDLLLKRMSFDDIGVEKISFDDMEKDFGDPDNALHSWMGIPFAMADEVHGVLFDPRHAALGARKQSRKENNEYSARATKEEYSNHGVHKWKLGAFAFPEGVHELVDLGKVRHLVDGGERAEFPARVEKMYEYSRLPFQSGTSATRFILILVALLAPFAAMWLIATRGGGGGNTDTVSYGALFLLASLPSLGVRATIGAINWKRTAVVLGVVMALFGSFLAMFIFVNPLFAVMFFIIIGAGFWFIPLLTQILKASDIMSGIIGPFLIRTGFSGYDNPVFEWTPEKYVLREYSKLDDVDEENVTWYALAGSLVGFTFEPSTRSWGAEVLKHEKVDAKAEVVADGGRPNNSNIPSGFTRAPEMSRADMLAAFVPQNLKSSNYYLHTGISTGRFTDSAVGKKSLERLLEAKEEHGGDSALSDRSIIWAMVICGLFSSGLGVFVFFL